VVSIQPEPWPEIPEATARVARAVARKGEYPLAMRVRDELGELFADAEFAAAFGARGRPGWSPGRLALVTVLQKVENLTDRAAAHRVRYGMDWKYALSLELDDEGFDASVLSEFRAKVAGHGLEETALDLLLEKLVDKGLLGPGGKQRTDSTHVLAAVRDLNRLELAGEAVRAALEALAAAEPRWVAATLDVAGWGGRYRRRVDSWRLPTSEAKRGELALAYGRDGFALLDAVYAPAAPGWLAELPAVEALRVVLVQNYTRTTGEDGREVVQRREAKTDGLPPGRCRLTSPYDTDARRGGKRDTFWTGYKVHVSETCATLAEATAGRRGGTTGDAGTPPATGTTPGEAAAGEAGAAAEAEAPGGPPARRTPRPNLVTNVATTDASVADAAMTAPVHRQLARRRLTPDRHYVDSGYPSADLLVSSKAEFGITLVTPLLADTSPQARPLCQAGLRQNDQSVGCGE
jgi:transposase